MPSPEPRVCNPTPTIITEVRSEQVGQDYRLFISLPRHYTESSQIYPVLYILDGQGLFTLTREIHELQLAWELLQNIVLVGVSYPVETHADTVTLRGRDLTFDVIPDEIKALIDYPFGDTGGGGQFLQFLKEEVFPTIERTYRTDPGNRGILGHSLGGTFVMRALFREPTLFQRAAALSFYLGGGDTDIPAVEARYAQANDSMALKLFFGVEGGYRAPEPEQVQAYHRFVSALTSRHYAGLSFSSQLYEAENHFSMIPIAVTHALYALYGQAPTGINGDD